MFSVKQNYDTILIVTVLPLEVFRVSNFERLSFISIQSAIHIYWECAQCQALFYCSSEQERPSL